MTLLAAGSSSSMLITISAAMSAGVFLIVIARRLGIPAIILLLAGGVALGPAVWGLFGLQAPVRPDELGDGLHVIVSLAIGLILFEGGLTLDMPGYRSAPKMIRRLLTVGVVITWFGAAAALKLVFQGGLSWEEAIIAGSLVIVTGPTVIAPLLKRVRIRHKLHSILHWEAVLIDPIGVFIALLCYEWILGQSREEALVALGIRVGWGMFVGAAGGFLLSYIVRKRFVGEEMVNVFALGCAVAIFGVADFAQPEAGLLAVTVAGFVFGVTRSRELKQIKRFKAEITDLLIGTLFILLASRLEFTQFQDFGWRGALAVALIIFLIRPLCVFVSGWRTTLSPKEKVFLSWIAPRGIVAASMASLIALQMSEGEGSDDRFIETFTYSVIISTIVLQGSTVRILAKTLGLMREDPRGWLIVGSHALSRRIANFLKFKAGRPVLIVDANERAVRSARSDGLNAIVADARDVSLYDRRDFQSIGNVLAVTDNEDLNVRICQNWSEVLGAKHVFRCNPTGMEADPETDVDENTGQVVWPRLPRPSIVAREVRHREAEFIEVDGTPPPNAQTAIPIAWIGRDEVRLDVDNTLEPDSLAEGKTLYLVRKAEYLLRAIHLELVLTLEPSSMQDLFSQVVEKMVELQPRLSHGETVRELLDRESVFPTLLGNGIAVPHAFSSGVDARLCAVARMPEGLQFGADSGDKVQLVFLLLSPHGDPEGHLATLAEIARMLVKPGVREALLNAGSPLEVIRIVRESTPR